MINSIKIIVEIACRLKADKSLILSKFNKLKLFKLNFF